MNLEVPFLVKDFRIGLSILKFGESDSFNFFKVSVLLIPNQGFDP